MSELPSYYVYRAKNPCFQESVKTRVCYLPFRSGTANYRSTCAQSAFCQACKCTSPSLATTCERIPSRMSCALRTFYTLEQNANSNPVCMLKEPETCSIPSHVPHFSQTIRRPLISVPSPGFSTASHRRFPHVHLRRTSRSFCFLCDVSLPFSSGGVGRGSAGSRNWRPPRVNKCHSSSCRHKNHADRSRSR